MRDIDRPEMEQFRRCVLAQYEGDLARLIKRRGRHWVPTASEERGFIGRAFAICTRSLQRSGYLFEGTQTPTAKGRTRAAQKLRDPEADSKHEAYEAMLRRARMSEPFDLDLQIQRSQPAAQRPSMRGFDLDAALAEVLVKQSRTKPISSHQRQPVAFDLDQEIVQARKGAANAQASGAKKLPATDAAIMKTLQPLRDAMEEVFSCDTVYGDCTLIPSAGHCILAAMVVQDLFGGELVEGKVRRIPHYWNRIGTREIDVTGDQFGFAEVRVKRGRLNGGGRVFSRQPQQPLDEPYNAEVCTQHDRFVKKLMAVLRRHDHADWADAIARCQVA